jgi:hypothetical protein
MTQASTSASICHVSMLITSSRYRLGLVTDKEEWKVATDECQQFYEHWRDNSTGSDFLNAFTYKLSLGADSYGAPLSRR